MSCCASLAHTIFAFFVGVASGARGGVRAAALPPPARARARTTAPTPHRRGRARSAFRASVAEEWGDPSIAIDLTAVAPRHGRGCNGHRLEAPLTAVIGERRNFSAGTSVYLLMLFAPHPR